MRYIKREFVNWVTYEEERSGVLVSVIDSNRATTDANVEADVEVSGLEGHLRAVLLEHHLSLKEGTLRSASVDDLRFNNLNGPILKVVVNDELSDAVVLEAGLDNTLLEVTVEAEHL